MTEQSNQTHHPEALVVSDGGATEVQWVRNGANWPPAPMPESDQWSFVRRTRNSLLAASDWTDLPNSPLSVEVRQQWQDYRQALRDITAQEDPFNIVWPVKPS